MAVAKRILVIHVDDISPATYKNKSITPKDKILIFSEGKEVPVMDGVAPDIINICGCSLDNFEEVKKQIQMQASGKNDGIYLVGPKMGSFYNDLVPLADHCAGIGKSKSFGVSKAKLYKKDPQQNMFSQEILSNVAAVAALQNESVEEQNKKEKQRPPKAPSGNRGKTEAEVQKKETTVDLQELEMKVFGRAKESVDFKNIASPLQDAKARLVLVMRNRFEEHVKFRLKVDLSVQQLYDFSVLMLKTTKPEEFLESWNANEPSANIKFSTDDYALLRGEADYYSKICAFLYEEDLWTY